MWPGSIRSGRVIEVLSKLVSVHGSPKHLRSDNGPEFVSRAVLKWLTQANIDTAHIDPGKPWQNGSNESFNGKFRDECLSMEWFRNRIDAKIVIEQFRRQYNEVRPHSSLGQLTPAEFKQQLIINQQPGTGHFLSHQWTEECQQVVAPFNRTLKLTVLGTDDGRGAHAAGRWGHAAAPLPPPHAARAAIEPPRASVIL